MNNELKQKQIELIKKYNSSISKKNKKELYDQIMKIEEELENDS